MSLVNSFKISWEVLLQSTLDTQVGFQWYNISELSDLKTAKIMEKGYYLCKIQLNLSSFEIFI